jgi:hypothetical protein
MVVSSGYAPYLRGSRGRVLLLRLQQFAGSGLYRSVPKLETIPRPRRIDVALAVTEGSSGNNSP